MDCDALSRKPSARTIARLVTIGRNYLSKSQTVTVAAIEGGVLQLVEAREVVAAFQAMIRKKSLAADHGQRLERAGSNLVAAFANSVAKHRATVSAAITPPWSNGRTEGQFTMIKLVNRQMYRRGEIDLLLARAIGAG